MDKQLEDKLLGMGMAFMLANDTPKSDAISDVVALVTKLETDLKAEIENAELMERKLIRQQVRKYKEI